AGWRRRWGRPRERCRQPWPVAAPGRPGALKIIEYPIDRRLRQARPRPNATPGAAHCFLQMVPMRFQVTVQPSQHQFSAEPGQTVLDAALAAGIVLPYSCRNGACSTCKGKVISGQADAGEYPAQILSPEELAQGYTLFCQARPQSDLVIESTEVRLASDIQIRK